MEILVAASSVPLLPKFPKSNRKSAVPHLLRCSRNNGEIIGISRAPVSKEMGNHEDVEVHQNHLKSVSNEKEEEHNDIWKLFKEAQQNIMYLNKQRLLAMEELDRVKNERNKLLDRVKQLELKNPGSIKRDKLAICSELLLRLDSLVLNGIIGSTEASDLRRLVMDSRSSYDDFYETISKNDAELLAELRHLSKKSNKNGFHVIHICTEMSPVVSVGSLALYVTGLSCALQRQGCLVEVILPKYACLQLDEVQELREVEAEFYSYFNGQLHGNKIWTGVVYGIGVTFIQPVYYSSLFSHERVYGCSNDFERFTYFSRASLDYLVKSGKRPNVLHIHNWQTSIVGPLFWDVFVNKCLEQPEKLALCGLDPSRLHRPDRLQDDNKAHLVNILKGGVVYSNKVIIMSLLKPKGRIISAIGHGLESSLTIHKRKLVIAPFGLDKSIWDPSNDKFLPKSYSAENMNGKTVCKVTLQRHLNLPEGASKILVGCIYSDISLVDLENLRPLVWMASRSGVQFIFMGSNQSPGAWRDLELFQDDVKDENVRFINEYDEELSHLIIAGSDIMLCQSFDDPLQVPLKAIRYGAAPVPLHFADSEIRYHEDDDTESTKLSQYINTTFAKMSLSRAIDEIKNNPSQWNEKIMDAMGKDFSWDSECSEVHISAYTAVQRL
ncbi:hypothetical protein ACJIZ3_015003 [Penstemon smallii]|uniref:starch synthase n=1 Tax=Penstemon smallii TaxID=265156 RepID=A0ABD3RUL0_9LAMI